MTLPWIGVQSDWDLVWADSLQGANSLNSSPASAPLKFWLSSYSSKTPDGLHTNCLLPTDSKSAVAENKSIEVVVASAKELNVVDTSSNHRQIVRAPISRFSNLHPLMIFGLDVHSSLVGVSSSTDGAVSVWNAKTGEVTGTLKGHIGDVNVTKLFPSGQVALSAGADTRIKIWSLELGKCAKTLTGHSAAVTSAQIIGRGRNFVTGSKDGTAKLWDCGQGLVSTVGSGIGDINTVALLDPSSESATVIVGGEVGTVRVYDCRQQQQAFDAFLETPINCCAANGEYGIVVGHQDGLVQFLDRRKQGSASKLSEFSVTDAPILDLCVENSKVWFSNGEGLVMQVSSEGTTNSVERSYSGVDCEYIPRIALVGESIYSASRGCVYHYQR